MPPSSTWYLRIPGALAFWKLWRDTPVKVADMRRNYTLAGLEEKDLASDPMDQFRKWFGEAAQVLKPPAEPNAMTLATCGSDGCPQARTVLLKGFDERGFTFFTNYESRKGKALAENPQAALLFHWHDLERQVEIRGRTERLAEAETEAYFRTRPVGSRVGAWASRQSSQLRDRAELEDQVRAHMEKFAGRDIPVPPFWGGYLLRPESIEFWQGRPSRLHDRLRYTRQQDSSWKITRHSP